MLALFLCVSSTAMIGVGCAEDNLAISASTKVIALSRAGGVDDVLFRRVADYVAAQCDSPVRAQKLTRRVLRNAGEPTEKLSAFVQDADVCFLVLAGAGASVGREIALSREKRIAVLDTTVLKPASADTPEGREQFGRRVEKESLRAIALVIGMPDCPFPRCALLPHRNDAELDMKSRNPCPPCLIKIRQKLRELGVSPPASTPATDPVSVPKQSGSQP